MIDCGVVLIGSLTTKLFSPTAYRILNTEYEILSNVIAVNLNYCVTGIQ